MKAADFENLQKQLVRNKRHFLQYNQFRKEVFAELAPTESDIILYLLPWLLSVNDPRCPGYVEGIGQPFRVYNIESNPEIRQREAGFKKQFGIGSRDTLIKPTSKNFFIQGLYTIGSIGTVTQTGLSDCDIWVCFNKNEFDHKAWQHINQKINLIKDWMDENVRMPVYFFISDVEAIRMSQFGRVDAESSGSTQQHILKEEFYRTCILICGKIPLWWLCYSTNLKIEYSEALAAIEDENFGDYDLIDFGNLEKVPTNEYFGAALWQFQKSLSSPLKSIIKMVLLKMLLDAPQEKLLCHQFRELVFAKKPGEPFPDCGIFSTEAIFMAYKGKKKSLLQFIKECFYLRCDIKLYDRKRTKKTELASAFYKRHPLERETIHKLEKAESWDFKEQIEFGKRLLFHLHQIYREISAANVDIASDSDRRDLTVLGRKISAFYLNKNAKVSILPNPTGKLNLSFLSLDLIGGVWSVYSGNDRQTAIVSHNNIIFTLAFVVWNKIFAPNLIRMRPNPSNVTHKEIINLGIKIEAFLGSYDTVDVDIANYLKEEHIVKLLIVAGFERSPWEEDITDYSVVYTNCWGEMFVQRLNSTAQFKSFLAKALKENPNIEINKYLKRNFTSYEKTIARSKAFVFPSLKK